MKITATQLGKFFGQSLKALDLIEFDNARPSGRVPPRLLLALGENPDVQACIATLQQSAREAAQANLSAQKPGAILPEDWTTSLHYAALLPLARDVKKGALGGSETAQIKAFTGLSLVLNFFKPGSISGDCQAAQDKASRADKKKAAIDADEKLKAAQVEKEQQSAIKTAGKKAHDAFTALLPLVHMLSYDNIAALQDAINLIAKKAEEPAPL